MDPRLLSTPLRASRSLSRCAMSSTRQCLRERSSNITVPRYQLASIHNSSSKSATPYPHAEIHAAPPPPPAPAPSSSEDRLQRRRAQAEALQRGQSLTPNPAKPVTALQKRFWKHVSIKETDAGLQIFLDTRPVRTANKNVLTVPKNKTQLAMGIALEWDQLVSAHQALKHHYIPLTSLVSRALDLEAADARGDHSTREGVISMLMRHFTTDTLLCWAPEQNIHDPTYMNWEEEGKNLRLMQADIATPIISYLTSRVWPGVEINPVLDPNSILPAPQPAMTQEIIREWVSGLKAYELAGLERAVLASKSLLVGVRLLVEWSQEFQELRKENGDGQKFGIEQAAQASSMEVDWQTGMWGEVEDTHDVEREDLRRQLGGVVLLVGGESA